MKKESVSKKINISADVLICFLLVAAIAAVYGQTGQYDFVTYDDGEYVYENIHVKAGLTWESIVWAFTTTHMSNWHPLTWLSYMLEVQIYGPSFSADAGLHHLGNVLFHIINSLLLFSVLKKMTGALWQSAFVAALFALHPLHVESVAWISERKDVLSMFFWLLTMGSYARYVESPEKYNYLITLMFFMAGLMSKPMVVTLPFVLILLDFWPLGRMKAGEGSGVRGQGTPRVSCSAELMSKPATCPLPPVSILYEKIPFFVLTGVLSVVTFFAQKSEGSVGSLSILPLDARIANALVSYISYIVKMILPFDLSVFYPHPFTFPMWQVAGAAVLLIAISAFVFRNIREKPYLVTGWLWYLGTLAPVIGLVQVGLQGMADRYTYIPLIGLFIMIVWGVPDFLTHRRYKKTGLAIVSTAIISFFAIIAWFQIRHWENSESLYKHAVAVTKDNYVMSYNLGNIFLKQGKTDEALRYYTEALRIKPDYENTHKNLGVALLRKGDVERAIQHLLVALRINPASAAAHNNLGNILASQGRLDEAIRHYSEALRTDPDNAEVHNNLGLTLVRKGNIDKAVFHFQKALRIQPDYRDADNNLKRTSAIKAGIDKAVLKIRETLKIKSESPNFCDALDKSKQELDKAIAYYQNILSPQPGYAEESLNIDNYPPVAEIRKEPAYLFCHK